MKAKRILSALLAMLLMGGLLAACSEQASTPDASPAGDPGTGEASAPAATGEKPTLSLYTWTDDGAYMQPLVEAYNAQSDVAYVELTIIPSDEYEDKMVTMMAGGTDVDMLNNRSMQFVSRFASTGNLYDLTDWISTEVDVAPYGTSYADTRLDNSFYALPYRGQSYVLFYNKKMFDDLGEPYPDNLTWDEYAELALKLTTDDVYGGYIPEWLSLTYIPQQAGSNLVDDDTTYIQQGLEFLNRVYNVDKSHMSYIEMKSTGTDYLQYFCSAKAAMLPNGDWCLGDIQRVLEDNPALKDDFELGVALLPQIEAGKQVTCGGVSTFISINARSKNPEASFDFVKWLCGQEAAILLAEAGMLPAYVADEVTEAYIAAAEGVYNVENLLAGDKVPEALIIPEYAEINKIHNEEKEMYLIGSQTIDETMENFIQRRDKLLNG